ncbi:MAG: hypothetical protein KatS3mg005_3414 [Bryobacteraceae bacterium]|jgi:hypothetical protein|nr:MAG: hypothetical protein KatS3mg005_3414 [Bryobacteraceae bacterium]
MRKLTIRVQAARQDQELGIIWGYASVADILDEQGDLIPQDELIRAVYEFMENYYRGETTIRVNHGKPAQAVLVESTFHLLGTNAAWFVGVKLLDEDLREAARRGEISGFSIGGWAQDDGTPEEPRA